MEVPGGSGAPCRAMLDKTGRLKDNQPLVLARKFEPADYGLKENFRLTDFSECKDIGCKLPPRIVNNIFRVNSDHVLTTVHRPYTITTEKHGLLLVQTSEMFYPMVDNPYVMGRIACNGVLGDLYALGVTECDNMLMFLNLSTKMTDKERDVVVPILIQGFKDSAEEGGGKITGGKTVFNPWLSIGGSATSACQAGDLIPTDCAAAGDVLVLTKPLGLNMALNARSRLSDPGFSKSMKMEFSVSELDVEKAQLRAIDTMARSNRKAAMLMHKYHVHCAVTVGELGLIGHAQELALMQVNDVTFTVHNLPVIAKMTVVDRLCNQEFRLLEGLSRETCGGLLVCISRLKAPAYCKEIQREDGYPAWIIGIVESGNRTAKVIAKPRVIEIPSKDTDGELW